MSKQRLRCIGGPNNGQIIEFDHDQREICLRQSKPLPSVPDFRRGLNATSLTHIETFYDRREIVTPDGSIEFLAPKDFSDLQALRRVLEP